MEGAPAAFGICFGLSAFPEDQGTAQRLVKAADDRLILSKKESKLELDSSYSRHSLEVIDSSR
jgi:hypothetical protein